MDSGADTTAQEIEQTLAQSRASAERRIALYRVWVVGAVGLLAAWPFLSGGSAFSFIVSSVYFAYSLGVLAWLRHRTPRWLGEVTLMVDLVSMAVFYMVLGRFDGAGESPRWTLNILPSLMMVTLLGNFLRYSGRFAIASSAVAAVMFLAVMISQGNFHPGQISTAAILLLSGFIAASSGARARQNLDTFARLRLLRRYLPKVAVERVLEDPRAGMALGGRSVTVTLLATDLRGFTSMSEKLSPEEVVRQLNAYHATLLEQVERHGGTLDKFIGDGALVVFGFGAQDAPEADHGAAAALACARDMLDGLERLNGERARAGLPPLRMGMGLHTGPVVAGNIGVPGVRLEFTVIGDAVNTAARLEGLTKEAGVPVLISAETVARLQNPALRELPAMRVRGKDEAVRVFTLP
ncbi:adenylate/guanylate cyclase domain-containing protein [Archangium lipolyticum]|uniref:adenylate/guanylate cyclase domain-containing protein n=1 Tax=Archangium lipolyticum TaxID=2970465 RepID=UPI00214A5E1C|nr:adenylate/guanylate cyclase domain-containing protein [Archangium lipolyticum]